MQRVMSVVYIGAVAFLGLGLSACNMGPERSMEVTATAYTMREAETKKGNVGLSAWGDQLQPGMKAIAVSRDLIKKGLTHETVVTIEGLEGEYVVRDKMNKRWKKKIDIFMGRDLKAARNWGKRKVTIHWSVPE
jgi:3D (Asp-Asp-Asp) domain-containing protein